MATAAGAHDRCMFHDFDIAPGFGGMTVVAGIGSGDMGCRFCRRPQRARRCVAIPAFGWCAGKDPLQVTTFAVGQCMGAGQWEAGLKVVELAALSRRWLNGLEYCQADQAVCYPLQKSCRVIHLLRFARLA